MFIASAIGGIGTAILGASIVGGVSSVMGSKAQSDAAGQAADAQAYATDRQIQYLEDSRDQAINYAKKYNEKAFNAIQNGAQRSLNVAIGKPIIRGARQQGVTIHAGEKPEQQRQKNNPMPTTDANGNRIEYDAQGRPIRVVAQPTPADMNRWFG